MNTATSQEFPNVKYSIERAKLEDALELAAMHNQSWIDTYPNDEAGVSLDYIKETIAGRLSEDGLNRRRRNIERSESDPTFFLRIAKNESNTIAGFIDGSLNDGKYELAGLYTEKSTHGTGLALKLWESYKEWADPTRPIWLTVVTYNERAKAFYKKIGFKELPDTERLYNGTHIPVVDMERAPENLSNGVLLK